jgi:hypothetical protein
LLHGTDLQLNLCELAAAWLLPQQRTAGCMAVHCSELCVFKLSQGLAVPLCFVYIVELTFVTISATERLT